MGKRKIASDVSVNLISAGKKCMAQRWGKGWGFQTHDVTSESTRSGECLSCNEPHSSTWGATQEGPRAARGAICWPHEQLGPWAEFTLKLFQLEVSLSRYQKLVSPTTSHMAYNNNIYPE